MPDIKAWTASSARGVKIQLKGVITSIVDLLILLKSCDYDPDRVGNGSNSLDPARHDSALAADLRSSSNSRCIESVVIKGAAEIRG